VYVQEWSRVLRLSAGALMPRVVMVVLQRRLLQPEDWELGVVDVYSERRMKTDPYSSLEGVRPVPALARNSVRAPRSTRTARNQG
jgi:hypothetical protein